MPIGLKEKQAIVAEVHETAQAALSAVMADYRGVSVDAMTALRTSARAAGVPCVLAFALEDPGSAARVFKDFAKDNSNFEIKALSVGGELLPPEKIDALAKLPTRDEALSLLMAVMQAPVTKLARTMNDIPGRVTRAVAAVKDQKQAA